MDHPHDDFDPVELGFTFGVGDAAEVLGLATAEVLDLIRAGSMRALVGSAAPMAPLTFHLHPRSVAAYARRREQDRLTADETLRPLCLAALREYLETHPPTDDYDVAMRDNLPLWGSTRRGRALHLRTRTVVEWVHRASMSSPVTEAALIATLERVGAVKQRGVTATAAPGTQRWGWWWRVPPSLLRPRDEDGAAADMLLGVVEPGERVSRRAGGAVLTGRLVVVDS
jgi:hypothetical protein